MWTELCRARTQARSTVHAQQAPWLGFRGFRGARTILVATALATVSGIASGSRTVRVEESRKNRRHALHAKTGEEIEFVQQQTEQPHACVVHREKVDF
jgi:hypothetical protein